MDINSQVNMNNGKMNNEEIEQLKQYEMMQTLQARNIQSQQNQQQPMNFKKYVENMPAAEFARKASENVPTSITDLKKYSGGKVVPLPEFAPGQPFYARLKRPSILALVKKGKIPNSMLSTANELFVDGKMDTDNNNMMLEVFDIMQVICEASLMEPTYKELVDNSIELTDEQLMFIFQYSQNGIEELTPISEVKTDNIDNQSGKEI